MPRCNSSQLLQNKSLPPQLQDGPDRISAYLCYLQASPTILSAPRIPYQPGGAIISTLDKPASDLAPDIFVAALYDDFINFALTMATNNSATNINTTLEAVFSFADFSALLALFGDEATKQFLATSISPLDTVFLGIAPLGIMTIIVSAIRVGGSPLMKSVIGRYVCVLSSRASSMFLSQSFEILSPGPFR